MYIYFYLFVILFRQESAGCVPSIDFQRLMNFKFAMNLDAYIVYGLNRANVYVLRTFLYI